MIKFQKLIKLVLYKKNFCDENKIFLFSGTFVKQFSGQMIETIIVTKFIILKNFNKKIL